MAKRRSTRLTPRQRQSQRIMREKTARKKRRAFIQKISIIGGASLISVLAGSGLWAWKSGAMARMAEAAVTEAYDVTVRAGFSLQSLYLEGRSRTSMAEVEKALGVKKGDPILRLSIAELRDRLEKIESVKVAAVERALPGTLYVRIVEREPVALWQHQGQLSLVDDKGVVMNDLPIEPYKNLPLIIGDAAPQHADELLAILASQPDLARRFAAAVHVGERRWNIRLSGNEADGGIEVRLPESNPAEAWKKLAELQAKERVLDRDIKVIDLRIEDRMFIKLAPQELRHGPSNAKET